MNPTQSQQRQELPSFKRIEDFHKASPVHSFYLAKHGYTTDLRKIFTRQHRERIKKTCLGSMAESMSDGISYRPNFLEDASLQEEIANTAFKVLGEAGGMKHPLPQSLNIAQDGSLTIKAINSIINEDMARAISVYFGDLTPAIMEAHAFSVRRRTEEERTNISGYWHRDSLGSRLKLFWCVHEAENAPSTHIIPSCLLDPAPREWEMIRTEAKSLEDHRNKFLEQEFSRFNPLVISQQKGSLLVFDTNCVHRGDYEPCLVTQHSIFSEYRIVFQISIIAIESLNIHKLTHPNWYYQEQVFIPEGASCMFPLLYPTFVAEGQD